MMERRLRFYARKNSGQPSIQTLFSYKKAKEKDVKREIIYTYGVDKYGMQSKKKAQKNPLAQLKSRRQKEIETFVKERLYKNKNSIQFNFI